MLNFIYITYDYIYIVRNIKHDIKKSDQCNKITKELRIIKRKSAVSKITASS